MGAKDLYIMFVFALHVLTRVPRIPRTMTVVMNLFVSRKHTAEAPKHPCELGR